MGPKNVVGVRELNLFYTFFSSILKFSQTRSQKGEENLFPKEKNRMLTFLLARLYKILFEGERKAHTGCILQTQCDNKKTIWGKNVPSVEIFDVKRNSRIL